MVERIYLIGFMGSGKSYSGKRLAQRLQWDYLDLDDVIIDRNGLSINQIFSQHGEDFFRQSEKESLHSTINLSNTIISCGGGTPCFFDNMDWIKKNGLSFYLKVDPSLLLERLISQKDHRPLIHELDEDALMEFITTKIEERSKYYSQADYVFNQKLNDDSIVEKILQIMSKRHNEYN
ncbi:MAG: shikimate kinase [Bacteroidota bacterium]